MKHACQICLLLSIFIWFVYQVRHLYSKNKEHKAPSSKSSPKSVETREEVAKFRRKGLVSSLRDTSLVKGRREKEEESGEYVKDVKDDDHEEEEQDVIEGGGMGDDDNDVNDQGKGKKENSEVGLEDLIDEEDQVKEDASPEEEIEGLAGRGKGSHGSRKVEEEDENDAEELTQELVDRGRLLGWAVGKDTSNREDPLFFRDRLIDLNENSSGDAQAENFDY